ncbi:MAG: glycosyltransferase [Deltaproteobacteria bacterium]|jgi:glycosyltransferase involved in cell wall biosynthesis|nr:glycosyltransferase [Deltaproteobacteria bacterium]
MHKVSIVIPAKNEENCIEQCLGSLFKIDFPREQYEIIVVDNGSTDSTRNIAESFGVKVISVPLGAIAAVRNGGAEEAEGNFLAFLDADCTVEKDWLYQATRYFSKENIVCFGSAPIIPKSATWVQQTWFFVREKVDEVTDVSWLESMNMFVRKDIFFKVGGFNEKLITCEDVDLSYRLAAYGKIVSDKRIVAIHHGEAASIKEFFAKERWRGKSNYTGIWQHGLKLGEIPSLVLPLYFITSMLFGLLLLLIYARPLPAVIVLLVGQLPLMLLSWIKIKHAFSLNKYARLLILYNVYFLARACAIF